MGIMAVLVLSFVALFTFSNMGYNPQKEIFHTLRRTFQPPARKAILVDPEGMAHRTADNTQMTKRDRSRMIEQIPSVPVPANEPVTITPAAALDGATPSKVEETAAPKAGYQYKEEQTTPQAVNVEIPAEPSISQKIEAVLAADPALSDSAHFTLRASFRDGLVILRGVVSDEKEKLYLATKAKQIPGITTVENQLHTLNDYTTINSKKDGIAQ